MFGTFSGRVSGKDSPEANTIGVTTLSRARDLRMGATDCRDRFDGPGGVPGQPPRGPTCTTHLFDKAGIYKGLPKWSGQEQQENTHRYEVI